MGNTYWITGTQIGMIIAFAKMGDNKKILELIEGVMENQLTTEEARKLCWGKVPNEN